MGTKDEQKVEGAQLPTPWNQIEAGMAAGLGLPILVLRTEAAGGGIFDLPSEAGDVVHVDLREPWDLASLRGAVRTWSCELRRAPTARSSEPGA